jgi:hypothetical protein
MAHLLLIFLILLGHLLALAVCVACRRWLVWLCDKLFLEVQPPPEGEICLGELKRLWAAPDDGMDLSIGFDAEGAFRKLMIIQGKRTSREGQPPPGG